MVMGFKVEHFGSFGMTLWEKWNEIMDFILEIQ